MPRPERPLDENAGVVPRLAAALRLLREEAGRPGYRQLATQAHYSAATLSEAAAGRKLPSLAVTLAYVRACGGDTVEWERRWHAAANDVAGQQEPPEDAAECPYVGLAAYGIEDAQRFFGRDDLVDELVGRLTRTRFLALFGASGSGKSSILRAGLLHR